LPARRETANANTNPNVEANQHRSPHFACSTGGTRWPSAVVLGPLRLAEVVLIAASHEGAAGGAAAERDSWRPARGDLSIVAIAVA
jgi:hypothetical protein